LWWAAFEMDVVSLALKAEKAIDDLMKMREEVVSNKKQCERLLNRSYANKSQSPAGLLEVHTMQSVAQALHQDHTTVIPADLSQGHEGHEPAAEALCNDHTTEHPADLQQPTRMQCAVQALYEDHTTRQSALLKPFTRTTSHCTLLKHSARTTSQSARPASKVSRAWGVRSFVRGFAFMALLGVAKCFQPADRTELKAAVEAWCTNSTTASTTFGNISAWDVRTRHPPPAFPSLTHDPLLSCQ
jgi:hypothetical protein